MLLDSIAIADFPSFSKFDRDFNQSDSILSPFTKWDPSIDTVEEIIKNRNHFSTNRKVLYEVFKSQYHTLGLLDHSETIINTLLSPNTYTVVTAHQPCLFTGPAFVLSKAISTIKLAQQIQERYPEYKIIPVFVIGSEDHDVEELNHTYLFGKKITWETSQKGPVGRYTLNEIQPVLDEAILFLNSTKFGHELIPLLEKAYHPDHSFADAFQIILNFLLQDYGMLILNTDCQEFKQVLKPYIIEEVQHSTSKPLVQKTQGDLKALGYDQAAYARDINFFYFGDGFRDRIEKRDASYNIVGKDVHFTENQMDTELDTHPDRFSPNVIMRPLYQEILLPNLAYVGGGGELAYWIERKYQFESLGVPYPMLIRRDSFMVITQEQFDQLNQYKLTLVDLAIRTDLLLNQTAESLSESIIHLTYESDHIMEWMDQIRTKAEAIDKTLGQNVEAEKSKILKSIESIEKKMLKAEKLKSEIHLNKVKKLQDKLMPDHTLLERKENFMTFYAEYGKAFVETLLLDFNPLDRKFKAIKIA